MDCSRQARITRTAISPRLATRTFIGSATLEAGPALLPEGLHALPMIRGLDQYRLAEALERPGRVQIGAHAGLDHPLGQAERLRRRGGQPRGERARFAGELAVLHDAVDEPAAQRLIGGDDLAGQHELLGAPEPDELDQTRAPADARDQPEVVLGQAEPRRARGDPEVARQRQLEVAADAGAVDRRDQRLLERLEVVEEAGEEPRVRAEHRRVPVSLERRDVGAHAEGLAGPCEHRDADALVPVELVGQGAEVGTHLHRDRVALLRAIDRDGGDGVAELVLQRRVGHARPSGRTGPALPRVELEAREEVRDLDRRRLRRIRAMHRVGLDRRGEVSADRSRRGLGRVGGAHEIAPALDRVVSLEHHQEARPLGHERAETLIEGPLAVDIIEAARLGERQVRELGGEDREAALLDQRHDLPDHSLGHRVGLDDGEGALRAHRPITFAIVAPMSAGLFTRVAPASSSASIFSAAVPLPPAMIAPAWPVRRPGGAVWPQMNATTGLSTLALMNAAASSSAVPPISPIIMIARVSGSSLNRRRRSTKLVPLTGSPPIPTHVDCPMPRPLSWPTTS